MRYRHSSTSSARGFTLIEMVVATMIMAITGTIIYNILYTGMVLFAKNSAVNVAHQEARVAVMQMEQDIHAAVSIPQLTDNANPPNAVAGNGPAAGISFQLYAGGPFQITPYSGTMTNTTVGYGSNQSVVYVRTPATFNSQEQSAPDRSHVSGGNGYC
ncbi:PulJ/GspJ family protein [Chthoniobacter flavus]|nr:prepilin-type N-terminal cleavage/methylation domain-containing protein [Chthoniobacter flavus]